MKYSERFLLPLILILDIRPLARMVLEEKLCVHTPYLVEQSSTSLHAILLPQLLHLILLFVHEISLAVLKRCE